MWLHLTILTIGALGVLIIHEVAHLLVGRAIGINAVTVSIGAGPTLLQFTDRFGTCWKLRLLPVGGGCAFPDGPALQPPRSLRQPHGLRSIRSISLRQRAIILLAGPLINAALAGALFMVTYVQDSSFSVGRLGKAGADLSFLIAGFSLAVALFNLLPVFPLDGGRLTLLAFEAFTGREILRETESRLMASGLILLSIIGSIAIALFVVAPKLLS